MKIGIVGATGAVGRQMIECLEERNIQVEELKLFASERSLGKTIKFNEKDIPLEVANENSFDDLDYVFGAVSNELSKQYHIEICTFTGDVGDYAFVEQMVNKTLEKFSKIDVLVNNAGISYIGLLTDMQIEDWNHIVATNLTSVFSTCRCCVPSMVSQKSGKIINISSVWGNVGASCEVAYSACKGGINSFPRALGKELAPSNIQVNAIACGAIDTEMNHILSEEELIALAEEIPAGRLGRAEEVADLAYRLGSENEYLTGQIIGLDGGWT